MTIVVGKIMTDRLQANGLRKIREYHRDHLGREYFRDYFAESGDDVVPNVVESSIRYEEESEAWEEESILNEAMEAEDSLYRVKNPKYSTEKRLFRALVRQLMVDGEMSSALRVKKALRYLLKSYTIKGLGLYLGLTKTNTNKMRNRVKDVLSCKSTKLSQESIDALYRESVGDISG